MAMVFYKGDEMGDIPLNTLILAGVQFPLKTDTRNSAFYIYENDDNEELLDISVDATFSGNTFEGNKVSPYIVINPIETGKKSKAGIIGMTFSVKTLEEAGEREDTFYIFEHEPFENYSLKILDIDENKAHVYCTGVAITDGYSTPYKTAKFAFDCFLPVITDKEDWEKYGL